ncbi:hypothetical protein [Rubricoccus marinus]|uniref:hypothetical protein n=1 Tax=Rubricoccus marinus TaxID=716817 RepID=UPI001C52A86A|nr:hypothetical protein [Rubricoccus marinus]
MPVASGLNASGGSVPPEAFCVGGGAFGVASGEPLAPEAGRKRPLSLPLSP